MRNSYSLLACSALLFGLTACGSGSDNNSSNGSSNNTSNNGSSQGNNSSGNSQNLTPINPSNVAPITVNGGLISNSQNIMLTSVTICTPGSNNCQTIDNIQIDTGSVGLRIASDALSSSLALPQQTAGKKTIAQCLQFAIGTVWGTVRLADVKIAGKVASAIPIQVIGDPDAGPVPADCDTSTGLQNTPDTLGANGVLGIGQFLQDCGITCSENIVPGLYYSCVGPSCEADLLPIELQLPNPVAKFSSDNNGTIITLPPVGSNGAPSLTGSLIFGIGTQANNGLGNATVYPTDPDNGTFTTIINGTTYSNSFIDSGSSVFFLPFDLLPTCSGVLNSYLCPIQTTSLSAVNQGWSTTPGIATAGSVSFNIANALSLLGNNPGNNVFNNLGAENSFMSDSVDWGAPFFFGRSIYTAINGANTPGGIGPYWAY